MKEPIAIIAGGGRLPIITAEGLHAAGHPVVGVGLSGHVDPSFAQVCDCYEEAGITRLARWIKLVHRGGASQAILVGRVQKTRMYDPLKYLRDLPDWRAAKLWFFTLRHDKRTDKMLRSLADELARAGVNLIDLTPYIPDHLAAVGQLTRHAPTAQAHADIDFGLPIVRRLGELDIGQAVIIKDREVIAVEAIEGTDAMIRRAGELCKSRGWVLIKTAKPLQDMRLDVPTIGTGTIDMLKTHGGTCLAVEAGRVILLDKPKVLAAADQAGIAIVGVPSIARS